MFGESCEDVGKYYYDKSDHPERIKAVQRCAKLFNQIEEMLILIKEDYYD